MTLPRRTTPHTRLSWNSLGGWQDAALAINARPPSRLRHRQIECHVIALSAAYINACSSAALLRSVKELLTSGDFRLPCRGRRANAPHTPLIVAVNNRLQRLENGRPKETP